LDEPSAIEFRDPQPAQSVLEKSEARGLRSSDGFATSRRSSRCSLIKSPNVFASRELRARAGSPRSMRRSISSAHSSASFRRRNVSLTYFPFRRTWARQDPDLSFVNVAKACALRVRRGVELPGKGSHDGVEKSAHDPT
jgi:hypothetical protein